MERGIYKPNGEKMTRDEEEQKKTTENTIRIMPHRTTVHILLNIEATSIQRDNGIHKTNVYVRMAMAMYIIQCTYIIYCACRKSILLQNVAYDYDHAVYHTLLIQASSAALTRYEASKITSAQNISQREKKRKNEGKNRRKYEQMLENRYHIAKAP